MTDPPLEALEDPTLAVAAARGSRPAFRELYLRHRLPLFRYLTRWLGDAALGEDALQETFLQVYQALDRYDPERPFRGWLYGIACNVALGTQRRRRSRGVPAPSPERADRESAPPSVAEQREQLVDVQRAFSSLPEDSRALLLQRHRVQLTLDELAEAWGCTNRTIRNRLHAANDQLVQAILAVRKGGAQ